MGHHLVAVGAGTGEAGVVAALASIVTVLATQLVSYLKGRGRERLDEREQDFTFTLKERRSFAQETAAFREELKRELTELRTLEQRLREDNASLRERVAVVEYLIRAWELWWADIPTELRSQLPIPPRRPEGGPAG